MILNSRIEGNPDLEKSFKNVKAGFAGEEKVVSYLKEVQLSGKIDMFTNVLLDGAQMDVVIISQKFICILEVKNMTGEFYFDSDNKQFYRIKNGQREGMRNPELQLQRAVRVLQSRLERKDLQVPVQGLIILASRAGIVIKPPTLFKAIPIDAMCDFIEQMEGESKYTMTNEEMKRVHHILKQSRYEIQDPQIFDRHGINGNSIRSGVRCTNCFKVEMVRANTTWICQSCRTRDKQAHISTLQEYQFLFGHEIKSKDIKWWLRIDDKFLSSRIIKQSAEKYIGGDKNRIYTLRFEPERLDDFFANEMKRN